jgi:5-formyltetrahydrofolate cyclo-ligase
MNDKQRLRREARARRGQLAGAVPDYAQNIAARYADDFDGLGFAPDAVVAGYLPILDEADPRALMAALAGKGQVLALPRVAERRAPLVFHRWSPGDATLIDMFGLSEPLAGAEIVTPSILLVPMLAFDASGTRLGYGGGYYDRTLALLRAARQIIAVGIAYAGQEVGEVPRRGHDEPLDAIVTEKGVRKFAE